MKKVLITGANSYIGTSFENYLKKWPGRYQVCTVDMMDECWRQKRFAGYDVVYHVAGIAHSDSGSITAQKKALYYRVNTDLTVEVARKAKAEGVKQFIFMSSAIVYGESAPIGKSKIITAGTQVSPANCYGDSKVQAEKGIWQLQCDEFKVVILRPPMVYGKGSKGNYPTLSKLAKKLPFFPDIKNKRSMCYIGNLVEFVRLIVENEDSGIFWPQNRQYTTTSDMVRLIGKAHGKRIHLVRGFGWALRIASCMTGLVNKAFGSMVYEQSMSQYRQEYQVYSLEESIELTEKENG